MFFTILQHSFGMLMIFGASVYYMVKKKNIAGILMVLGMLVTIIFSTLSTMSMFEQVTDHGARLARMRSYSSITYISYFTFVAGFVILIINASKKDRQSYQLLDDTISGSNDDL